MEYVAGFLFNDRRKTVALIEKNKPDWQRGKLNAIGGKIEAGETPLQAMRREFLEETGMAVEDWNHYCTLRGDGFIVYFFRATVINLYSIRSTTDERVAVCSIDSLPEATLPNVPWLIHMALAMDKDRAALLEVKEV